MSGGQGRSNRHIGQNIKFYRRLHGMSQKDLGDRLGVSSQQIQKYESGANQIGAARLHEAAKAMDIPVSRFFDGLREAEEILGVREAPPSEDFSQDSFSVLRAYRRLPPHLRRHFLTLAEALAQEQDVSSARKTGKGETKK